MTADTFFEITTIDPASNETHWSRNADILLFSRIVRVQACLWYALCSLVIPGNVLTIILVKRNRKLQTPSNILVAALAVADLTVGINGILTSLLSKYVTICDVFYATTKEVLLHVPLSSASAHVFLIAVDRYIAIVYPLRYEVIMTLGLIKKMVAAVWLIIFTLGFTMFVWPIHNTDSCWSNVPTEHSFTMLVTIYFGTAIFLVFAYTRITLIARKHTRQIHTVNSISSGDRISTRRTHKTTKILSYISVAYFLAWTPYIVFAFIQMTMKPPDIPGTGYIALASAWMLSSLFGIFNSGVNFFIYAWTSKTFRKGYLNLIMCCGWKPDA